MQRAMLFPMTVVSPAMTDTTDVFKEMQKAKYLKTDFKSCLKNVLYPIIKKDLAFFNLFSKNGKSSKNSKKNVKN